MWDVKACRCCLLTKGKLERINNVTRRMYSALTGINATEDDGYPTYFCVECRSVIKKAIAFRRKCRRAFFVMKEIVNVKKQITLNEIGTVDRKRTNLISTYGLWTANVKSYVIEEKTEGLGTLIENLDEFIKKPVEHKLTAEENCLDNSVVRVDIKPSIIEEIVEEEQKIIEVEKEHETEEVVNDIPTTEDPFSNDDPFNDNNNGDDDDFTYEDFNDADNMNENKIEDKSRKNKTRPVTFLVTKQLIQKTSLALTHMDLRLLSVQEQNSHFGVQLMEKAFRHAMFKCGICVVTFPTMNALKRHVDEHNINISSKHMCHICKGKYSCEEDLEIHTVEQHAYEYTCQLCKEKKYSLKHAMRHMEQNHENVIERDEIADNFTFTKRVDWATNVVTHSSAHLKCDKCPMKFMTKMKLQKHVTAHKVQFQKGFMKCSLCNIYLQDRPKLVHHIELWHKFSYTCMQCSEVFYNRSEARWHIMKEHKRQQVCQYCDKTFSSHRMLSIHMKHAHANLSLQHHCNLCGAGFSTLINFYSHQLTEHKIISINDPNIGEDDFACKICNVKFVSRKAYVKHALIVEHEEAKTFENTCYHCKIQFETAEEYEKHDVECDNKPYPKKCPYCPTVLKSVLLYRQHHRRLHRDMPLMFLKDPHLCELCGVKVTEMRGLVQHMRHHAAARDEAPKAPWARVFRHLSRATCALCQRSLAKQHLLQHVLALHTDTPFVCALCNTGFSTRCDCRRHILKVHAPEKLYKCDLCDSDFSYYAFLYEHKINAHNVTINKRPPLIKKLKKNYVYPHMKLNVTKVDPNIWDTAKLVLVDYLHKKWVPVEDRSKYFITDDVDIKDGTVKDDIKQDGEKKRRKRRKRNSLVCTKVEKKPKMEEISQNNLIIDEVCNTGYMSDGNVDDDDDGSDKKLNDVKDEYKNPKVELDGEYQIYEIDGVEYVNIDDVVYKVDRSI